jgi:hypothetical protein
MKPVAWMNGIEGILSFDYMGAGFIPLYTNPAKTLTDEEIAEEWAKFYPDVFHTHLIDFARAILRKAQEK